MEGRGVTKNTEQECVHEEGIRWWGGCRAKEERESEEKTKKEQKREGAKRESSNRGEEKEKVQ